MSKKGSNPDAPKGVRPSPPPGPPRLNEPNGNGRQAKDFICTSCNSDRNVVDKKEWAERRRVCGPM